MPHAKLHAETVARAAAIVGYAALAAECGISVELLLRWTRGEATVTPDAFLRASEIITEAGIKEVEKKSG